jgi:hypothetical protein
VDESFRLTYAEPGLSRIVENGDLRQGADELQSLILGVFHGNVYELPSYRGAVKKLFNRIYDGRMCHRSVGLAATITTELIARPSSTSHLAAVPPQGRVRGLGLGLR